jgi:hypothetical protein
MQRNRKRRQAGALQIFSSLFGGFDDGNTWYGNE